MIYFIGVTALGWLIPNHYYPWTSAWGDGVAIFGILFALFGISVNRNHDFYISLKLIVFFILCFFMIVAQFLFGKIVYFGDAWMSAFYIFIWLSAVFVGNYIAYPIFNKSEVIDYVLSTWIISAIFSVGVALVQWTGVYSLGIYGVEMPFGGRPYANLAQPNNLCTLCFVGLCSLFWMHQKNVVKGVFFWIGIIFLIFGMVMTQSRTGWLQITLLVVFGWGVRGKVALKISRFQLSVIGVGFLLLTIVWPNLCDALFLSTGRSLEEQVKPGSRLSYWWSMLDAISREPLWGYGWNQIGMAQQRVALDYPVAGEFFEHSHNLFLDFILWNGVLVGGGLVLILISWFLKHIWICKNPGVIWMLISLCGIFVHGMLEYPLEYAYFLIPAGIIMGIADGLSPDGKGASLKINCRIFLFLPIFLSIAFLITAKDYLKSEESYRTLRVESARLGVDGVSQAIPNLNVLTQLDAFLKFIHTEATPEMTENQLKNIKEVSERFGYPPVLFRYALASGINGDSSAAKDTLNKICHIHGNLRCAEARENWIILQSKYKELIDVEFPNY